LHRDIKLENLLIDEEGNVKICDFGVSQLLNEPTDLVKDQCGTPAYMAPEVFECTTEFSGYKADVWSLGICLFAMLCGMVPFKGRNISELKQSIISETLKYSGDAKQKLSREVRNLVKIMLRKDPSERATIDQVLRHPWLRNCPKKMFVFSQSELKKIKVLSQPACGSGSPQRLLTEVDLTQRSLTES
jgi:serine/threonine protein kinase